MIVRILGEGQFDLPATDLEALNELDDVLLAAVEAGDEPAFQEALTRLLERVRTRGRAVPADRLEPSELVLPRAGTGLAEVRGLLGEEGLIPGG
ncbi:MULTISPECIES: PspA-associated protein PspAA [unclassified Frankia]